MEVIHMSQALSAQNKAEETLPISPTDTKAWQLVNIVLDWMAETGSYNYSEAFRQTGVERYNHYRAIKRPFIQGKILERMNALDRAAAKLLEVHWPGILANIARIAGRDGRDAVQAARFLAQEKERIQQQAEEEQEEEGPSRAAVILARFQERDLKLKAQRTTVTEELQVN